MTSVIHEMKKTLDANETHIKHEMQKVANEPTKSEAKKSTAKVVAKPVQKPTVKPQAKSSSQPIGNKTYKVGDPKKTPPAKRFADVFEKAVTPKTTPPVRALASTPNPEVILRVEVNSHQVPPWETPSAVVSVQAPNLPETVVARQDIPTATRPANNRRYDDVNPPVRNSSTGVVPPQAVMGVLGSGFRPVSPTIKR